MMMTLLWILSAQPLLFALILAFRTWRSTTRMKAKRRMSCRPSLPISRENYSTPLAAE